MLIIFFSRYLGIYKKLHNYIGVCDPKYGPYSPPLVFAINSETGIHFKVSCGKPSLNLLDMIRNDLKRKQILGPLLLTELNGSNLRKSFIIRLR